MLKWMFGAAGACAALVAAGSAAQDRQRTPAGTRDDPIMVTRFVPGASDPVPATNPGTWVTADDYPNWAVRYEVDGIVRVSVDVDPVGRVTGCEILDSSGVPELDEIACTKISERASFRPAQDHNGHAVPGKWANTVRWQIPSDDVAMVPPHGALVVSMTIERDGSVSTCEVETSEGDAELIGSSACEEMGQFAPILDENGNPRRTRVRTTVRVEHEALPDK